jgi:hypothetical protein
MRGSPEQAREPVLNELKQESMITNFVAYWSRAVDDNSRAIELLPATNAPIRVAGRW